MRLHARPRHTAGAQCSRRARTAAALPARPATRGADTPAGRSRQVVGASPSPSAEAPRDQLAGHADDAAPRPAPAVVRLNLPLADGAGAASATATTTPDGGQDVTLTVSGYRGGRLLAHWGLVGGPGYSGRGQEWRVPSAGAPGWDPPPGTVPYKSRALQTPLVLCERDASASDDDGFVADRGADAAPSAQTLTLHLPPSQASDALAFVLKDEAAGEWVGPPGGGSWALPLPRSVPGAVEEVAAASPAGSGGPYPDGDLVASWALAAWQAAGCPDRDPSSAASAFAAAATEVRSLLGAGASPAELRAASASGAALAAYRARTGAAAGGAPAAPPPPPPRPPPPAGLPLPGEIPGDLVGTAAYLLWEAAGKPDGADFGDAARAELARRLADGASLDGLRAEMGGGPPAEDRAAGAGRASPVPAAAAPAPEAHPPPLPPPPPPPAYDSDGGAALLGAPAGGVPHRSALSLLRGGGTSGPDDTSAAAAAALAALGGPLPAGPRPLAPLEEVAARDDACVWQRTFGLGGGYSLLATVVHQAGGKATAVTLTTDLPDPALIHWGVRRAGKAGGDWAVPPEGLRPAGTADAPGGGAAETALAAVTPADPSTTAPLHRAVFTLPSASNVAALVFVLRAADGTRWWRDGGGNFAVPVVGGGLDGAAAKTGSAAARLAGTPLADDPLAASIVASEVESSHWTLMHRFNAAADALEARLPAARGDGGPAGAAATHLLATLFVWLRLSSARHLTWQRNYNTQPRLLGEAQDRLSRALAAAQGATRGEAAEWARACLACVGRGSGGQAVRDEILNIMHRHRIPELKGTWMEAWHQKLHNNTTPDDVAICEAYLAFLGAGGDAGAYWASLSAAGISRERLASFDRPIVEEPEDFPEKRAALIDDFRSYLAILKSVHAGADLSAAAAAVGDRLPPGARPHLGAVMAAAGAAASGGGGALATVQHAVEARAQLAPLLAGDRDLIYLDLALEAAARGAAEGGARRARGAAAALVGPLLRNLALSLGDNADVCFAAKAWDDAPPSATARGGRGASVDDARRAAAAADRARRAVAAVADRVSARLTPIASALGPALDVPDWATALFAEEVVRGGPAFGVSLALSAVEPGLRSAARLSAWQVVAPGTAVTGTVVVVDALYEVMDTVYPSPTVLVVSRLSGEEEVPDGAVAVLAADAPDVLSHLAVRARNGGTLLAACFESKDGGPLDELRGLAGQTISVSTSAAGGVTWAVVAAGEGARAGQPAAAAPAPANSLLASVVAAAKKAAAVGAGSLSPASSTSAPAWCGEWAVGPSAFAPGVVGAKSRNLADLRGRLPAWVRLPPSVAVPYGVAEEALRLPENKGAATAVAAAVDALDNGASGEAAAAALAAARAATAGLALPPSLRPALASVMAAAGVPVPASEDRWLAAEAALKGVWASAFNERAALSMRKAGLPHASLRMAVLVQAVVPAAYAFVIHTTNPTSGDETELFAEVVAGLGEAIVSGAVPGAALAFAVAKREVDGTSDTPSTATPPSLRVLAYPSKGRAFAAPPDCLIFRSDSNGEDLPGYAGAGLYDSITMDESKLVPYDSGADPLVCDEGFRNALLTRIAAVGVAVEGALGGPQDIEGVVEADGSITVVQARPQV